MVTPMLRSVRSDEMAIAAHGPGPREEEEEEEVLGLDGAADVKLGS